MTAGRLYVEGELHLSLEVVAEVYAVEIAWLREVYDAGLLGAGVDSGPTVCISVLRLDRVAAIVRMHHVVGQDVETLRLVLEAGRGG
jgi:hypothetical protein